MRQRYRPNQASTLPDGENTNCGRSGMKDGLQLADIKYREHHSFSLVMTYITSLAGTSLWLWDHTIDPEAAHATVWIRALIIPNALAYIYALHVGKNYKWAAVAAAAMLIGWEIGFIAILSLLKEGMIYGQAGFAYFFMMPLLVTRCLPFTFNAALVFTAGLVPLLFNFIGFLPDFPVLLYCQFVTPLAFMVVPALYAIDKVDQTAFRYRSSLQKAAFTDPLTGIANRRKLDETVGTFIQRGNGIEEPLSILIIDIDDFKKINDTFGHATGDRVIKAVAQACENNLRSNDMISRIGGEEFVVVLPQTSAALAWTMGDRLRKAVSELHIVSDTGLGVTCTVSVGTATERLDRIVFDALMQQADASLYRAKQNGKNQVGVDSLNFAMTSPA